MKLRPVLRFLGRLLLFLALAQLAPLVCSLVYGELEGVVSFSFSALITGLAGGVGLWIGRGGRELYRREGILMVVGGWVLASLFGALPYLFSATLPHPVDAFFEAASGFTTTGATVLTDIEAVARGVLFWRSFTQWLGGMGIIVLFVALLPELGPGARFLYKLEVPGPSAETLSPRIRDTAAILWRIYLALTLAETFLLMVVGLDLYEALTHTFSTLSTGGFSPHSESIAYFPPLVQLVIILFMVVAGGNFSLYYGVLKGRGWNLLRDPELRIYLVLLAAGTAVVTWNLLASGTCARLGEAGLAAVFQVTSIMTTTGFVTADFEDWPALSRMLLVVLMFVGGSAGSTAGSMKVMRMVIGLKSALREVRLIFSPNAVISVIIGGKPVPQEVVHSVAGFFILYLSSWGLGSLLLTFGGAELVTAATASIATLGNVGPGLEAVGPIHNYAFFSSFDKLMMVLLMWLGRLEVYSIAALFTLRFWRP